MTAILIMMNNYFHDVATAVLVVSAVMLFVFANLAARAEGENPGAAAFFLKAYNRLNALMAISLAWIILGGIVRTLAYMKYEWLPAAGRGQIPALVVKHVMIFSALGMGIYFWLKVRAMARALKKRIERH